LFLYRRHKLLTIIVLIGAYLNIHLYLSENIMFPSFISSIFGMFLLFVNRRYISSTSFYYLKIFIILILVFSFFTPQPFGLFIERLKGFLQISINILVGYGLFLEFKNWEEKEIARFFLIFVLIIITGTILENYLITFKDISDSFRHYVFKKDIYENNVRDIRYMAGIRPKLFTQEPSMVAKFLLLSIVMYYAFSNYSQKLIISILGIISGLFLIRSPIVILAFPLIILIYLYEKKYSIKGIIFSIIIIFIVMFPIYQLTEILLYERIQLFLSGREGSFFVRVIGPIFVTLQALKAYPFFGIGIAGKEVIESLIYYTYASLGYVFNRSTLNLWQSFIWRYIVYFGVLGSIILSYYFYKFARSLRIEKLHFFVFSIFVFSQTTGPLTNIRTWTFIFFMLLILLNYNK